MGYRFTAFGAIVHGFLAGLLIHDAIQEYKNEKTWKDVTTDGKQAIVTAGIDRSSNRDSWPSVRDLCDNGSQHGDNSRDKRERQEHRSGTEESSILGSDSSAGSIDTSEGS